jgi:CubicO group peptidase (beta-lactamase class C family)
MKRLVAIATCLVLQGVAPPQATLADWLAAFNAGDTAKLEALGDNWAGYEGDAREETGGLDLVRVESDDGTKIVALLRERETPETWHITLTRDPAAPSKFAKVRALADPMSEADALKALDRVAAKLAKLDKFSGVLVLARDGKTIFAKAYGTMDEAGKVPMTLDTRLFSASQGKMFTATAIWQLIASGKVKLDDTVGKFLADYPNRDVATKVTVRMLLAHRDGTGEMGILEPQDGANRAKVRSIADIIALNGTRGPAFEPGSKFDYGNYGYILLGAIVEKASGEDYYDYVQHHVFDVVGMTHTSYPLREDMDGIAVPMTPKDGKLVSAFDQWPWRGTPAGGGVSTPGDMVKFIDALDQGKLIPPALLAQAITPDETGFGLGFINSGAGGLTYWGHGGGAPGDSTVADHYPKTHVTFACMANRDPPACDRIAMGFLFRSPR